MKILICSANYAPELTGIGKYSGEMAEWLAARGHEVRVVAAPPYYPAWQVAEAYRGRPFMREHIRGVHVWRAPIWVPQRAGGLARVLHLVSFGLSAAPLMMWWALWWRPAVCFTTAPFLSGAPAVLLASALGRSRSWLHVQDFEVDVAFNMGLLKGGRLKQTVLALEQFIFRRFDRVSSISQKMVQRLSEKGVSGERQRFFRNWVDVDAIQPLKAPSAFRSELGLPNDAVVALFSGTLGAKQGLQLIPQAARLLAAESRLHFVICGDGATKVDLQRQGEGLSNLHFLPLQPLERLGELLGMADMHLLTQDVAAEDLVLPSKLSGMLASGRPVIATCAPGTELAQVLQSCGTVVAPGDAQAFADAIRTLARDPEQRRRWGVAARHTAVQTLGREQVLAAFEGELLGLV